MSELRRCRRDDLGAKAHSDHSLLEAAAASHHHETLSDRSNPSDADQLFDVVVVCFETRNADPAEGLRRLFGLELEAARALLTRLPATVRRNVNPVRAEYFRRALASIGAAVEIRRPDGSVVELATAAVLASAHSLPTSGALSGSEAGPRARLASRQRTLLEGAGALPGAAVANDAPSAPAVAGHPQAQTTALWGAMEQRQRAGVGAGTSAAPAAVSGNTSLVIEPNRMDERGSAVTGQASLPALSGLTRWDASSSEASAAVRAGEPVLELGTSGQSRQHEKLERSASLSSPAAAVRNSVSAPSQPPKRALAPNSLSIKPAVATQRSTVQRMAAAAEPESFWDAVPECIPLPVRGAGLGWIAVIAAWTAIGNALAAQLASVVWLQTLVALAVNVATIVLCAEFHRQCMTAIAEDDSEIEQGVLSGMAELLGSRRGAMLELAVFTSMLGLPIILWCSGAGVDHVFDVLQVPKFWVLIAVLSTYWPAALTALNRGRALWRIAESLRAIARAPLAYVGCVFFGSLAFALPWLMGVIVVKIFGLSTAAWAAVAGAPLALSHGVLGALAGQWLRSEPDIFD